MTQTMGVAETIFMAVQCHQRCLRRPGRPSEGHAAQMIQADDLCLSGWPSRRDRKPTDPTSDLRMSVKGASRQLFDSGQWPRLVRAWIATDLAGYFQVTGRDTRERKPMVGAYYRSSVSRWREVNRSANARKASCPSIRARFTPRQ